MSLLPETDFFDIFLLSLSSLLAEYFAALGRIMKALSDKQKRFYAIFTIGILGCVFAGLIVSKNALALERGPTKPNCKDGEVTCGGGCCVDTDKKCCIGDVCKESFACELGDLVTGITRFSSPDAVKAGAIAPRAAAAGALTTYPIGESATLNIAGGRAVIEVKNGDGGTGHLLVEGIHTVLSYEDLVIAIGPDKIFIFGRDDKVTAYDARTGHLIRDTNIGQLLELVPLTNTTKARIVR